MRSRAGTGGRWPCALESGCYLFRVSTLAEIEAAVPGLTTAELVHLEQTLHQIYRARGGAVVYDDRHGVATEADLVAAADEAFQAYDREETAYAQRSAR